MKKLLSFFSSMRTMAILMLIFAFAIAWATFIENDYGTMTAKADIYNARWFETLLGLLTFNLVLNMYKFKMYTLSKAPLFIFHVAFVVILLGAAMTRYIGFEGSMHIREGYTASTMTSTDAFVTLKATSGDKTVSSEQHLYLSKRTSNTIQNSINIDDKKVSIELLEYIPDAVQMAVEDKQNGIAIANMMVTGGGQGKSVKLKEGEYYDAGEFVLDFNSKQEFSKNVIKVFTKDDKLFLAHKTPLGFLKMDDGSKGDLAPSETQEFARRTLFSTEKGGFVLKEFLAHASTKLMTDPNASAQRPGPDALKFKVSVDGNSKELMVMGQSGRLAKEFHVLIDSVDVALSYGSKTLQLPFKIYLKDFQLDRYPGSMSPASYASEVELIDEEQKIHYPYRIFMNNILEHRGYRFFQASFDKDEKGTILSVNNDPGTLPSYIGYALLALGMFWSLFSKRNRFSKLAKKAKDASEKQALPIILACGIALGVATPSNAQDLNPTIKTILSFEKPHAKMFGELIVQDSGGRMKPMNTLSTEILSKIYGSSSFKVGDTTLNPDQVVLGMMVRPDAYRLIKMIKTKDKELNKIIGAREDARYASFSQFFQDADNMRGYKLAEYVDTAVRKEPKHRNKFDKKVLKVDEKVNIAYMVYTGALIKIWAKPADVNNKWFATIEALQSFSPANAEKVRAVAVDYFTAIDGALSTHDWAIANRALENIAKYQKNYGAAVYPSENRIRAEVFYNEAKIFERLYPLYLLLGFLLLILSFIKILKPNFKIDIYTKITLYSLVLFFIAHTIGLANRWYISGHAPWSDGYESMIYIAWATVLAGFIFSKRSSMTMASTGILAGLILFVAHLNWMNPQVTNLVPVLNSYWLSIHVSMITASYGFLGLGALLGFISIILFMFKTKKNEKRISLSIRELNAINEMGLMVGLVLLTVGNFLGGVWANESWGRYWGWDPKETWALVTILVYAVVLHLRFIKSIYNEFNYSVISLLAFTSVLMTYFGVNYYLAGMHSYAKGDPVPIPDFVPVTYFIIFVVIALAFRNRKLAK